ncbi:MAG: phosphoglycerate kinase [Vicinamibacterales bacterium]|nr:phosphoglycerate kinase [Vicinamibacterales bacterium]
MAKRSLAQLDLAGRRVFVRVDFNVPLKGGVIGDDTRIRASIPTIQHVLAHGARSVVLASHLGRPKGKPNADLSLRPVAERLSALLGSPVTFAEDCVGETATAAQARAGDGGVVLLENLRFHAGEEKDDPAFAAELAALADVYVNDAFGAAHRAHASVHAIVGLMKDSAAGLLMAREVLYLGDTLANPARPFVAILGGAKVSDKIEVIENLMPRVDRLLIGGAMAYTFFKAQGLPVGTSLVEDDKLDLAREILARAKARGLALLLPTDHVVATTFPAPLGVKGPVPSEAEGPVPSEAEGPDQSEVGGPVATLAVTDPAIGDRMGLDIGPATSAAYTAALADAKTVIWNGPMGVFEVDAFAQGTLAVARAVAAVKGTTIIGGGDSISAARKAGVSASLTHISTGGGASLEFLGGRTLPGVAVLPDA